MATCDRTELLAAGKCFDCLDEGLKQTIKLQLLCEIANGAGGGGTVTSVSVATANGFSGTVADPTTTPAITIVAGAITPISAAFSGTAGNGFVSLLTQSSAPAAPASGFSLFADSTGRFSWRRASDGFTRSFDVTATANRTFTIPDADLTFAGQNYANTFSVLQVFSANGALSAPAVSFTGAPIAGGTATTTKPMVLIETSGATSTGWNTAGTLFGVNSTGGALILLDVQANGGSRFSITGGGVATLASSGYLVWNGRAILSSPSAANLQLGAADAAAPVAQKLSRQSVVAGTSNTAGVLFTDTASLGTGLGDPGSTGRQTGIRGATGTVQHTAGWRDFIAGKDTTLTEATATTLFTVTVGTGKYLGMIVECTVFASDGTDFQVLHSTLRINTGNKAGTLGTTGIMQTDCATPYNSAGTLTPVTYTLVDNGSGVLAVKCAATSSLAQTTLSCKYQITAINSSDAITITPA